MPLGRTFTVTGGQRPPTNWSAGLQRELISLIGIIFKVQDVSFLAAEHGAASELEDMSARFLRWLLAVIADEPSMRCVESIANSGSSLSSTPDAGGQRAIAESR